MILDTSFLIDLMRGYPKALNKLKELEKRGETLYVAAPTIYELYLGIELSQMPDKELRRIEEVLKEQPVLPLDEKAAQLAGTIQGRLMRKGQVIDPLDALISGVALAHEEGVVTRNAEHFSRVEKLKVESY